jgi:hypothetical protein
MLSAGSCSGILITTSRRGLFVGTATTRQLPAHIRAVGLIGEHQAVALKLHRLCAQRLGVDTPQRFKRSVGNAQFIVESFGAERPDNGEARHGEEIAGAALSVNS